MSRRCRASLVQGAGGAAGDLSSGCNCGRLGPAPEPCVLKVTQSWDTLTSIVSRIGLGPNGDEVPYSEHSSALPRFSDGNIAEFPCHARFDHPDWPIVSTLDPPVGETYHYFIDSSVAGSGNHDMQLVRDFSCIPTTVPYFTAANPGDLLTLTCQAKASALTGSNELVTFKFFFMNEEGGVFTALYNSSRELSTSYETYVHPVFMPEGTVLVRLEVGKSFTDQFDFYLGAIRSSLLPAGQNILLCAQANLITIDNSTVETAFL